MPRVLLIEDNADLAAGIAYNLRKEKLDIRVEETGKAGLDAIGEWDPDLVILDLMLPDIDGFEILERLRRASDKRPVLILSAKDQEDDKIRGFHLDADQYVTKPFSLRELLARVHSLLRRAKSQRVEDCVRFGDVEVHLQGREVYRRGERVELTPKAFDLLSALIRRGGGVASRVDLLQEVWGHRSFVLTRTVDGHIAELRRKLEDDAARPRHIITVWKVGYRLVK